MFLTESTLSVNLTTGVITQSDPISARRTLSITLTGTGSLVDSNMRAALYRLNRNGVDGLLVATCNTFSGAVNNFLGTMSLNTSEMVAAFTNLPSVREWETLRFELLVYDASTDYYLIWDGIQAAYEYALAAGTPGSVSPITSSTTIWGNLKLEGGTLYIQNLDTGLWNPLTSRGADNQQHLELGDGANI